VERFDERALSTSLRGLTAWRQIVFMAMCCERMLPHYRLFSEEAQFGDVLILQNGIDEVWRWVLTGDTDKAASMVEACERQAPNTEEHKSKYTSAALDCASAVATTLEAIAGSTEPRAMDTAELARDTVDLYVQQETNVEPNALGFEEAIRCHPLMQRELRRQREDLRLARDLSEQRSIAVREAQRVARDPSRAGGILG